MKKAVFTVCNYYFPLRGVLTMHAAANVSASGEVAVFFGLSGGLTVHTGAAPAVPAHPQAAAAGTGKTSLSADPSRQLIGDDEHVWSDDKVSNIEGMAWLLCCGQRVGHLV